MIWLLRHGEAAEGSPDSERPLTEKGERQAKAAGLALSRLGAKVQACLTSPKVRAADTARLACAALGVEPTDESKLAGGPFDPEELADFSMAVHKFTGAQVRLKKGGLAGVERGELKVLLRPTEIEAIVE